MNEIDTVDPNSLMKLSRYEKQALNYYFHLVLIFLQITFPKDVSNVFQLRAKELFDSFPCQEVSSPLLLLWYFV